MDATAYSSKRCGEIYRRSHQSALGADYGTDDKTRPIELSSRDAEWETISDIIFHYFALTPSDD
jgi:hypothetical protein